MSFTSAKNLSSVLTALRETIRSQMVHELRMDANSFWSVNSFGLENGLKKVRACMIEGNIKER